MIAPRAGYEGAKRKHFSLFLGSSLLCGRTDELTAEPRVGTVRHRCTSGRELKERIFEKRRKRLKIQSEDSGTEIYFSLKKQLKSR